MGGKRYSKGGSKKRNKLSLDMSGFANLIEQLDEVGGDIPAVVEEALENAGEDIGVRTKEAMEKSNLPAKGIYSEDETIDSVIINPRTVWTNASMAEIGVGFDFLKKGVGGLLITGTPKMEPNYALEKIYVNKKYQKELNKQIGDTIAEAILEKMEG